MMASIVPPPQPKSRWSATTAPGSDIHHDASGGSSDSNFPFPVSLPPSPHHPEGTFTQRPTSFGARLDLPGQPGTVGGLNSHPADLVSDNPTSPTDSVPMSVSDIHFRHSDTEEQGSREHSSGGLPTHPPLPPAPAQPESYIVQRVLGISTPSPNLPITTLTTPTPTATNFNASPSSGTTSRPSPSSSGRDL